jgi:CHAT domain-containing protein
MFARAEGESVLHHAASGQGFGAFDFAASREAMSRLDDYRIVHLAVHAVADTVRPELSALILSKYGADGRRRPGVFRLHAVTAEINLRADVVVLSACSSVDGRDVPGEGLMGLARGFFAAGATSVIGALTTVQEEPTLELMKVLYEEMLGPHQRRPAEALRLAQMKMIGSRRFGDPFYWSPFVFIGDPR